MHFVSNAPMLHAIVVVKVLYTPFTLFPVQRKVVGATVKCHSCLERIQDTIASRVVDRVLVDCKLDAGVTVNDGRTEGTPKGQVPGHAVGDDADLVKHRT